MHNTYAFEMCTHWKFACLHIIKHKYLLFNSKKCWKVFSSQISVTWGSCMTYHLMCIPFFFLTVLSFSPSELWSKMSSPLQPVTFHNFPDYSNECYSLCSHGRCIPMYHMAASCLSPVTKPSRKWGPILFSGHKHPTDRQKPLPVSKFLSATHQRSSPKI